MTTILVKSSKRAREHYRTFETGKQKIASFFTPVISKQLGEKYAKIYGLTYWGYKVNVHHFSDSNNKMISLNVIRIYKELFGELPSDTKEKLKAK